MAKQKKCFYKRDVCQQVVPSFYYRHTEIPKGDSKLMQEINFAVFNIFH